MPLEMITPNAMMDILIEASPSFEKEWLEFQDEWKDEKGQLPYYLALGDFARHVKALYENKEENLLKKIFEAIERLHSDGDSYVKEAATVGFLEALQNISASQKGGAAVYEKYLFPETEYWWNKLNNFWEEGEAMVDDRNKA